MLEPTLAKDYYNVFFLTQVLEGSNDVASGSDITPCIKINKPLVVYRFSNVRK